MAKKGGKKGVPGFNPFLAGALIPKPNLRTVDVLVWLYRNRADRFTVRDIAGHFKIPHGEAQRRVYYMVHSWSTAKALGAVPAHRRGRREIEYALTDWGRKFAAKKVKG